MVLLVCFFRNWSTDYATDYLTLWCTCWQIDDRGTSCHWRLKLRFEELGGQPGSSCGGGYRIVFPLWSNALRYVFFSTTCKENCFHQHKQQGRKQADMFLRFRKSRLTDLLYHSNQLWWMLSNSTIAETICLTLSMWITER